VRAEAARPGSAPGERGDGWPLVLREARALADLLGWGAPRALSVVHAAGREVFGLMDDGAAVHLAGGREALPGQMRQRARQAATEIAAGPASRHPHPHTDTDRSGPLPGPGHKEHP